MRLAHDKFLDLENEKRDLMALLKELSDEVGMVRRENHELKRKLSETERENQLLIEKCLRYTEDLER